MEFFSSHQKVSLFDEKTKGTYISSIFPNCNVFENGCIYIYIALLLCIEHCLREPKFLYLYIYIYIYIYIYMYIIAL